MKNYIDLFENADDDDVPAELTTDESTQINRRVYSSDCQESVLVNNKGHIKQSDRTRFVDKIGCSVWTSRVNQLLVSSYVSETDHHFGKNTADCILYTLRIYFFYSVIDKKLFIAS